MTLENRQHLLIDLHPYVCLWQDCKTPRREYGQRSEFEQHVLQNHWKQWSCCFGCLPPFYSEIGAREHIREAHSVVEELQSADIEALTSLGESIRTDGKLSCDLFSESSLSVDDYVLHLSRHQERLVFSSFPCRPEKQDIDDDSESDEADEADPRATGGGNIEMSPRRVDWMSSGGTSSSTRRTWHCHVSGIGSAALICSKKGLTIYYRTVGEALVYLWP